VTEGHLDGVVARDATITFRWDEVSLQGLLVHMVTNQYFHCSIEISLKKPQGPEIGNLDRSRLFLQKNLKAGLPAGEGVAMCESHFSDQGMELSNPRTIHTCLVMAIM